jgi:hypothetical protein
MGPLITLLDFSPAYFKRFKMPYIYDTCREVLHISIRGSQVCQQVVPRQKFHIDPPALADG